MIRNESSVMTSSSKDILFTNLSNDAIRSVPNLDNHSLYLNQSTGEVLGIEQTSGINSLLSILLISTISAILTVFTIAGNILVIIAFKINKQLQNLSNYCLVSLAVSDLTVGIFLTPMYTLYLLIGYWPLGSTACNIWLCLDYSLCTASELNMLVIALDRHLSVTRPFTYLSKRTPRKMGIMIAAAWTISIFIWSPLIVAWPYIEGKFIVPVDDCYIQFLTTNAPVTTLMCFMAFYIPVFITGVLYIHLYREMNQRRQRRKAQAASRTATHSPQHDTGVLSKPNKTKSTHGCISVISCRLCCRNISGDMNFPRNRKKEKCEIYITGANFKPTNYEGQRKCSFSEDASCTNNDDELKQENVFKNGKCCDSENSMNKDNCGPHEVKKECSLNSGAAGQARNVHTSNAANLLLNTCGQTALTSKLNHNGSILAAKVNGVNDTVAQTASKEANKFPIFAEVSSDVIDALPSSVHRAVVEQILNRKQNRHQDNRTAKVLSALLLVFIISFAPYYTCTVVEVYCNGCVNSVFYSIGEYKQNNMY